MILALGMRFKSGEVSVTKEDINGLRLNSIRSVPFGRSRLRRKTAFNGLAGFGWHTAALAMNRCVQVRPFGAAPAPYLLSDDRAGCSRSARVCSKSRAKWLN